MFDVTAWPPDRVDPAEVQREQAGIKWWALGAGVIAALIVGGIGSVLGGLFESDPEPAPRPAWCATWFADVGAALEPGSTRMGAPGLHTAEQYNAQCSGGAR